MSSGELCIYSICSGTRSMSLGLLDKRKAAGILGPAKVLLKSISIAHTAFPVENSSSAPAPALTATHLWSESTVGAVAWGAMAGGTDIFLFG